MKHLGDYDLSTVIYGMFNTFDPATGGLVTLGGSGASLIVFKNNGTSESQAGVTLTIDFDGRTGCHTFAIDTSADGAFYSAGGAFSVVINGGMAGSVSLAGAEVASFSLRKDSSLKPTTAARTLDVSATGEAGIDLANVGSPTTALALTNTTISATQVAASVTGAVGSVTGAVGSVTGNVGGNVIGSVASVTGNVGGNVVGSVASVVGAVGSVTGNVGGSVANVLALAADSVNASALAANAVAEIQSGLATSAGQTTINNNVIAVGVLVEDVPTNAEFNARTLAAASYATAAALAVTDGKVDTVDTVVDGIAAKTVQLTFGATNTLNANVTHVIADPVQQNGSTTTEWGGAP